MHDRFSSLTFVFNSSVVTAMFCSEDWAIPKISIRAGGGGVKFCLFDVGSGNLHTVQMPSGKSPEKYALAWNYLPIYGYDEWNYGFQFRSPGKLPGS